MIALRPALMEVVTAMRGLASREVNIEPPAESADGTRSGVLISARAPHVAMGCGAHLSRRWPALALIGAGVVLVIESLVVR